MNSRHLTTPAERLDEIAEILAAGILRVRARLRAPPGQHREAGFRRLLAQATFVSVPQQFNTTTSMGRLTLNIRDKFAASREKGIWMGGWPPLGYEVQDRRLEVVEREAALVELVPLGEWDGGGEGSVELRPTEKPIWGVAFLFGVPISEEEAWAWSWKIRRENRLVAVRRASLPRA